MYLHFTASFYRWLSIALGFLLITASAAGALGVVWLRQEKSRVSERIENLRDDIRELDRHNGYLADQIAKVHHPAYLATHAAAGLRPTTGHQVVWMELPRFEVEPEHYAEQPVEDSPLRTSFDLALLGAPATPGLKQ